MPDIPELTEEQERIIYQRVYKRVKEKTDQEREERYQKEKAERDKKKALEEKAVSKFKRCPICKNPFIARDYAYLEDDPFWQWYCYTCARSWYTENKSS